MNYQRYDHEFTSREGVIITPRERTDLIKHHLTEAGRHLLIMRESEEWRELGYQSFTQYLEMEFAETRQHLYDLMRAAPVVERLQQSGHTPNTAQALALAKLPDAIQVITYEMAAKRKGGASADRIEAIGGTLTEALATGGYVTTKDGSQAALENAIQSMRTEQEIMKRPEKLLATAWVNPTGDYLYIEDQPDVQSKLREFWRAHQTNAKVTITISEVTA